jgi:hypothetical protein
MATSAQIEANRENAQKSTGARTEAGKRASSRNAVRHGLTGHIFTLLEWESAEEFDAVKTALEQEHKPATPTEKIFAEKMVQHYWLAQRCTSFQTLVMSDDTSDPEQVMRTIDRYIRYQTHHQRQFQQALSSLLKLRAETRKAEIGFVSQKAAEAQETRRAAAETRKTALHTVAMEIKKQRLEREKYNPMMAAMKAGEKMSTELPPNWQELAA